LDPLMLLSTEDGGLFERIGPLLTRTFIAFQSLPVPVENFSEIITEGQPLDTADVRQVIMGRKLAASLGVKPGDWINVATTSVSGNFSAASARIMGVFKYNDVQQEGQLGFVSLDLAKKILRTDKVERIIVSLVDLEQAETFAGQLQDKLDAAGIGLSVRPWQQLNPLYDQVKEFGSLFSGLTNVGVFILAFFGVLEVLTISFLERTREVGTVRAIGTKRGQVFSTFLMEGVVLGVLGGAFGIALGAGLGVVINGLGLSWLPPGAIDPVPVVVQVGLAVALIPFLVALISTVLGAIYPALKSSRFNIVRALGYV